MPKPPPASVHDLAEDLHLLVCQLVRHLRAAGANHELGWSHLSAMARLESEPMTIAALARIERVKPQSMGATIKALEKAGFVQRGAHATDRRQQVFSLTRSGHQMRLDATKAKRAWLASTLVEKLSPGEQRTVRSALDLLRRLHGAPSAKG